MADSDRNVFGNRWIRGLVLLVLVGAVGHVVYWYWPRSRSARPSPAGQVAALVLAEEGPEIRVWIPFPHQNLKSLERSFGDLDSLAWAWQAFVGSTEPIDLPSFGPYRVPPATEMAVASDRAGTGFVAMARVYPASAWLLRAAGLLGRNPWMAGGDLNLGGRNVRVEWQGNLWIARTQGMELGPPTARTKVDPSLMVIRLGSLPGPVAAGVYRLLADGPRLVLTSKLSEAPSSPPGIGRLGVERVALSWNRLDRSSGALVSQSWVALSESSASPSDLPRLLIAETQPQGDWQLPGQQVFEALGAQLQTRSLGIWHLRSYDSESLQVGEDLVAGLEAMAADVPRSEVVSVGYIDLSKAYEMAYGLGEFLQKVPMVGDQEARKWLALARLLTGMKGISSASLWIAESDRLELQFWPAVSD